MYPEKSWSGSDSNADQPNRRCQFLMSQLTHEIRNPLTLIHSSLQLLELDHPELQEDELWRQVRQDVRDVICLLRDLSPASVQAPRQPKLFLPSPLLERTACSCRSFMQSQNVQFVTDIESGLPPILGNEIRLREALLNLLLNACDAAAPMSHPGRDTAPVCSGDAAAPMSRAGRDTAPVRSDDAAAPMSHPSRDTAPVCPGDASAAFDDHRPLCGEVSLSAHAEDGQIRIHVRDNGPGIPAAYRDTLFEDFVTHKEGGTGLGLGIIRETARQHGGSLSFTTSTDPSDNYTDFCLSLPAAQ